MRSAQVRIDIWMKEEESNQVERSPVKVMGGGMWMLIRAQAETRFRLQRAGTTYSIHSTYGLNGGVPSCRGRQPSPTLDIRPQLPTLPVAACACRMFQVAQPRSPLPSPPLIIEQLLARLILEKMTIAASRLTIYKWKFLHDPPDITIDMLGFQCFLDRTER